MASVPPVFMIHCPPHCAGSAWLHTPIMLMTLDRTLCIIQQSRNPQCPSLLPGMNNWGWGGGATRRGSRGRWQSNWYKIWAEFDVWARLTDFASLKTTARGQMQIVCLLILISVFVVLGFRLKMWAIMELFREILRSSYGRLQVLNAKSGQPFNCWTIQCCIVC